MELTTRFATLGPSTFDEETRTVEATITTFAPVQRRGFVERLDPAGLDESRIVGAPVLDGHRQGSARDVIGKVLAVCRDGDSLIATLQLSGAPDAAPIVERIREGTLTGVSVGYRVSAWAESTDPVTRQRVKTATAWQIQEVSAVAIPADASAVFRSREPMEPEDQITMELTVPDETRQIRAAIREIARSANLTTAWADDQIDTGATVVEARSAAFEAMQARGRAAPRIRTTAPANDDPTVITRRQSDALAVRMAGGDCPDDARPFMGFSFADMARDSLALAGQSTRGLGAHELVTRALGTTDFPLVVSNAMNKVALEAYKGAESVVKTLARQRLLPNFKTSTSIRLSGMGRLEEMTEQGEFTHTSRTESGETLRLGTYGRAMNVTQQLLIDDDAGLLGDITASFGEGAAQTEADLLVDVLTSNPNLSDGTAVFDATRGNVDTVGSFGTAALDDARKALRTLKGLDGTTIISAKPKFLLVGPELETVAEQLLAEIYPTASDDVNPFTGKLQLLVEPRIADDRWYLFSDPASRPTLAYAYLASAPGVQIQRTEAWDTLGLKFRAWLDFGCGWTEWRGAYYGPES